MKSFTRVGLPVLLVVGVVFGITFIRMYSGDEDGSNDSGTDVSKRAASSGPVLKFWTSKAVPPKGELSSIPPSLWHMAYWDPQVEMAASGHYAFLCENRNAEPVKVRVYETNCQCAGVDLAVIPRDTFNEFAIGSVLSGGPLLSGSGPLAALMHVDFSRRLTWLPLFKDKERHEQTIPGADPSSRGGPQLAFVRLNWTGKGEPGPKTIAAEFFASIGENGPPSHTQLAVETTIVPAFDVFRRTGPSQWVLARELPVGELRENSVVSHTIYLGSATRHYLVPSLSIGKPDPCITWTDPVRASDDELASVNEQLRASAAHLKGVRTLYKMQITVKERVEIMDGEKKQLRQLDLGPLDRKLVVSSAEAGNWSLSLRGRVLGDVTVQGGAEGGRIDLGDSFPADQDRSRDVILVAERAGLDLTLLDGEITPNYLKVKFEPLDTVEGRKKWRLRVTVPKGTLYGALPDTSGVVLQTNDPIPRRFRIPVRGMTYDSGGPRL
jgi:hypothetical protein